MKLLLVGDTHINEESIEELDQILQKDILKLDADEVIQLGDFFHSSSPTPREIEFASYFVTELKKKYKNVTVLAGTGRHSSLGGVDITAYLKYLGIKPVGIEHEIERDDKKILLGHWMTNKSLYEYGTYKHTVAELKKKYDIVALGHLHIIQDIIKNKIFHLGSVRFVSWNEAVDKYKRLAMIDNGKVRFVKITKAIPMKNVNSRKELEQQPKGIKVRLNITNMKEYLAVVDYFAKWKKDYNFSYILRDLKENSEDKAEATGLTQKEFTKNWLKEIKETKVKDLLTTAFIKESVL